MNQNNWLQLFFFTATVLILGVISLQQVMVKQNYAPFSYRELLKPKTFFKVVSKLKNKQEYHVSLAKVGQFEQNLNSLLPKVELGYQTIDVIHQSTDQGKVYFGGTNDYQRWDLNQIDLKTHQVETLVANVEYPQKNFVASYQPIFAKIAYPQCLPTKGCQISIFDLEKKKVVKQVPTVTHLIASKKAKAVSQFFYDETLNVAGYKSKDEFYTLDLNQSSPAESLLQLIYLDTAGKIAEFLFYYPETAMMLFKTTKKPGSKTNHPPTEYFLYAVDRPSLVILNKDNIKK